MTDLSEPQDRPASTEPKKPYESPQLQKLGSVVELTAGVDLAGGEAGGYS